MGHALALELWTEYRFRKAGLILPPACDKMGKKRKRVEENAVRTNAGNAEKLLGHPENVY